MNILRKLTWVELKLFAREPFALVFTFVFPIVVLSSLVGSFEPDDTAFGGATPTDYYLASYVGVVIAAVGLIALPVHVAAYRERGVLRRFRASSVPAGSVFGAQVIVGFVTAALGSLLLVVVGRLVYDAALPEAPGRAVIAFVVGSLSFLALGFLLASLAPNARAAQALGMILFFPMWLFSGAGPPPEVMSAGMQQVSELMPLTYVVRALQDPWFGSNPSASDLLLLAAILIVATLLSIWRFRSV